MNDDLQTPGGDHQDSPHYANNDDINDINQILNPRRSDNDFISNLNTIT